MRLTEIYIYEEFQNKFIVFYKHTYAKTDNASLYVSIRQNSNRKQHCKIVEKRIFYLVTVSTIPWVQNIWTSSN